MRSHNVQSPGSEVGGYPKVLEVAKAFGQALCELKDPVDGLDGGIGELGFHVGQWPDPLKKDG